MCSNSPHRALLQDTHILCFVLANPRNDSQQRINTTHGPQGNLPSIHPGESLAVLKWFRRLVLMILGWRRLVARPSWHLRFLEKCVRFLGAPGLSRPSTFRSVPVLRLRRQRQPRKFLASVRRSSQKDHVAHLRATSCSGFTPSPSCSGFMPAISASNTLVAMQTPALT